MTEKSMLDARLAEIDRRLRTIQSGLEPAADAAQAAPAAQAARDRPEPSADVAPDPQAPVIPPDAAPAPKRLSAQDRQVSDLAARLAALVEAQERLLASTRDLTDWGDPSGGGPSLSVSAGPFDGTEALRRFERALQALPEVRSATVREYEGADRAIVDVHLFEPNT
jgi:hypothetical protein